MKPRTCPLLLLTLLLLLLQKSLSIINPNYVACEPFECGRLSISYPFFVPPKQPSFCGSQGFEVSCNHQNQAIFNLSNDNYIINQINYQDLSISIANSAFSSSSFGCLSSVHNLTFDQDDKFSFTSSYKHKELLLLQSCTGNIASNKNYTKIKCEEDGEHYDRSLFAVYEEDFHPEEVGKCNEAVEVPYEEEEYGRIGIEGLLRKGVIVEYRANNCSVCQTSGGRCGFDENTRDFFCFCPDRNHRDSCPQPKAKGKKKYLGVMLGIGLAAIIWFSLFIGKEERSWVHQFYLQKARS